MKYLTTNDVKLFVDAMKHYISKGHAVSLLLDMATIAGVKGIFPHTELCEAVELYNSSSENYNDIFNIAASEQLNDDQIKNIYELLTKCAEYEEKIGDIFRMITEK
ncbi:MAG: hypothetical protein K0R54_2666 [Clostridiaceae bacterium]|jgi:hypothetical protein|nr:hypothetical protein [Clostridiaceae bacterium]